MTIERNYLSNRTPVDNRYSLTDIHIDDSVKSGTRRYGFWKVPAVKSLPELPLDQGTYEIYTIGESDIRRVDLIAWKFYQDVNMWWVLCVYNNIANPFEDLTPGQKILIPNKTLVQQTIEQAKVYT